MEQKISRRGFLRGAAAGTIGTAAFAMLSGCSAPKPAAQDEPQASAEEQPSAAGPFVAGEYRSVQATPFATVEVTCSLSEGSLDSVTYAQTSTSEADYFPLFEGMLQQYCESVAENGRPEGVDGVTGATLCTAALKDGVADCMVQAMQLETVKPEPLNPQVDDYRSFSGSCEHALSPIKLGSMELPNRIIKSAGSSPWKNANKDSIPIATELYGAMAAGGVSLVILTSSTLRAAGIPPEAVNVKGDPDEALATVAPLVDAVHQAGGKIGFQMCYGGGAPTVPDSVINESTVEEIDAFMESVVISAERAKRAGFDCIEIKGASADALNGFLSRRVNRREDDYGPQSIENRTRIFRRMIETIKETNGDDFPVGALINGVEENDASLGANDLFITIEESQQIAKALEGAGADWIQLRVGATGQEMNIWAPDVQHVVRDADGLTGYGTRFDYSQHFEGMVDGSRSGFAAFLPMVEKVKETVSIPVGCVAYMDLRLGPDFIDRAVAEGKLDLVFMNRPLNCDPELVAKMADGRREDVIPCMKCMHCHDGVATGGASPSRCRMNATSYNSLTDAMPEGRIPLPAEQKRTIMVIGAGPAGLEAARVAAERGHSVSLYDSASRLGGLVGFARGVKGNHENFDDFLAYFSRQMEKNGVDVHLNTEVDEALVKEAKPDAVVVAVGGTRPSLFSGANVFMPEDAFGSEQLGENVVVLGAGVQAVDFAAYLVAQGKKVTIVNPGPESDIDKGQGGWLRSYILPYLRANGTKVWNNAVAKAVGAEGATIETDMGVEKVVPCDSVVEFHTMEPNAQLADAIEKAGFEVHRVGDCAEPRNIQRAIETAHFCARAL